MPSFWDSGFIVLLALLLFGPKKLPVLARQLGKLMGDFRRASNEFRSQMEEELRISEQAERQKQIAAIEAAAPATPALTESTPETSYAASTESEPAESLHENTNAEPESTPAPLPIATAGDLSIMPPATGLPVARSPLAPLLDSIPPAAAAESTTNGHAHPAPDHDPAASPEKEAEARPWMI